MNKIYTQPENGVTPSATLRHIKCLVASPSDTTSERGICKKVIGEVNKSLGMKLGFFLETRMWEEDTHPSMGEYPQAVVNEQLGSDYDMFVGIMRQRFGTPTNVAGSGTEEEFNRAHDRHKNGEEVKIMFYFCTEAVQMDSVDLDEAQRIKAFRQQLGSNGALYDTFNSTDEFEEKFRRHLTDYLLLKFGGSQVDSAALSVVPGLNSTEQTLQGRLDEALVSFAGQPVIWVDPVLSKADDISHNPNSSYTSRVKVEDLVAEPGSLIIKAPPQFGLTCLAHKLVLEAWRKGQPWVYLDSKEVKAHHMHKAVEAAAGTLGWRLEDVKCILLDSWNFYDAKALKKLRTLCSTHPTIPVIVLNTIDESKFGSIIEDNEKIERDFRVLHLLALPRTQLRKVVAQYNDAREIGDEDIVLAKVVSDLQSLNIHRTPLNCLTLLRVAERDFDESPVNRTKMVEMVLFALFNMDGVPTYASRLDLKDCEYMIGRLCESMIRQGSFTFTRDQFVTSLTGFGKEQLIDLDIDKLFDVLFANHIIVRQDAGFVFRASYWFSYFAAKRMLIDPNFRSFIFESKKYTSIPEIIEFYTGIDRNRADALQVLCEDLRSTRELVSTKVGLPANMNPYDHLKWLPTEDQLASIQADISQSVQQSGLPDELKDQHADNTYNQLKPYNQSIQDFFEKYSVYNLIQKVSAASRALRNSDYVEPGLKREVLAELMMSWQELSKVLIVLAPVLAAKGVAAYEGATFWLGDGFGNSFTERLPKIIQALPTNVVGFYKDDLASGKIGPLLFDQLESDTDPLRRHELALLTIFSRPKGWRTHIEGHIASVHKNSFYLADLVMALQVRYRYDFLADGEAKDIEYLIKMGLAKHEFGDKRPGLDKILKISNRVLPKREGEE